MVGRWGQMVGGGGLLLASLLALLGPAIAPNHPGDQFPDRAYAPPMRIHFRDANGFRGPFVYRQVLEDRLMRKYRDDTNASRPLGALARARPVSDDGPLLLLGGDALGRDILSRLLYGARLSLGVTLAGAFVALVVGAIIGGLAGTTGGLADTGLMTIADFILILPGIYLVLVLRAVLPQVLSTSQVFWTMAVLFGVAGWPHVARGVRAIVVTERGRDYAEAARAAGAGPIRVMRHLVPAAEGFLGVEVILLVPALLVAEATISFLGLGFPEPTPSWGTMLQEAANVSGMTEAPWTLAPAVALFFVVICLQLVARGRISDAFLLPGGGRRSGAERT
jgi:peptide/nickel transport system permease protein